MFPLAYGSFPGSTDRSSEILIGVFSGFNEFIHERETKRPDDPTVKLFDEVILAKRNRGKTSFFHSKKQDFLTDTTDHLWRTAAANPPSARFPGEYRKVITRSKYM